jgi:hypothetical protein
LSHPHQIHYRPLRCFLHCIVPILLTPLTLHPRIPSPHSPHSPLYIQPTPSFFKYSSPSSSPSNLLLRLPCQSSSSSSWSPATTLLELLPESRISLSHLRLNPFEP